MASKKCASTLILVDPWFFVQFVRYLDHSSEEVSCLSLLDDDLLRGELREVAGGRLAPQHRGLLPPDGRTAGGRLPAAGGDAAPRHYRGGVGLDELGQSLQLGGVPGVGGVNCVHPTIRKHTIVN